MVQGSPFTVMFLPTRYLVWFLFASNLQFPALQSINYLIHQLIYELIQAIYQFMVPGTMYRCQKLCWSSSDYLDIDTLTKHFSQAIYFSSGNFYWVPRASLIAQMVKNMPVMQKTWVQSLGLEDPLEKGMATHSSILAWRIPCTEQTGKLQSMGLQRIRHDWATNTIYYCISGPMRGSEMSQIYSWSWGSHTV